ncbi:riboflavin synthase [candidate division KSB1 bacterium]|nr:riboflavin synthase [candidate division KSB1 bacterium]
MFTGLVEEIGRISQLKPVPGGMRLTIHASRILDDLKVDDSVSVNGICLTATAIHPDGFEATAVQETLERSTLQDWKKVHPVNLERALRLSDRLGGHLVQGHVDGVARIQSIQKKGEGNVVRLKLSRSLSPYLIEKGSIAIDGVSLTIAEIQGDLIAVVVIPHTWQHTTFQFLKSGKSVNIEVDLIGKYVEKMLRSRSHHSEKESDWLKSLGY